MLHAVARVVTSIPRTPDALAAVREPRTGFVEEQTAGVDRFDAGRGPVDHYVRTVTIEGDTLVETVEFRLAIPYFRWLFTPFVWWMLRSRAHTTQPWWAPPDTFDRRSSSVLGTLAAIAVVFGYLNTVFTQTIAFAGDEFHAGNAAQGVAGGVVRIGGLLALLLASIADRRGRRVILLVTLVAGCALAATGAVAPSLPWLAASQVVARGFSTALLVVGFIVAAEELPAGSRAYGFSLLAMASGLGSGICVLLLRVADLDVHGWRVLYVVPVLGLLLTRGIARRLPESRRYSAPHAARPPIGTHARQLWLLAGTAFLGNVFIAPNSQFVNRFLRHEHHYSGGAIGLLSVGSGIPAVLGIVVGGRIADTRGRRHVGAFALVVGTLLNVAFYFTSSGGLWLFGVTSSVVGALAIPALAVYGPELFPTELRGRANGVIAIVSLAGSIVGLVAVGALSDSFGHIAPAMAIVAVGPLLYAWLVIRRYPETARLELEDINPEDRVSALSAD